MGRICCRFGRVEPRRRAEELVRGLASDLSTKNCWTIGEHIGAARPDGLQHLLRKAVWDHDAVRDDLRSYVAEHLGSAGGLLVVDETGDLKKGSHTVGVSRQYTGTAGRIENAQVAVYLAYASDRGHALIDRALYLPQCWALDTERRGQAGVPDEVEFATKPALAQQMIIRALDGGVRAPWVAADEVYGADPGLRGELERRGVGYVLAVACSHPVTTAAGKLRADAIAASLPRRAWQRLSAGAGSKGPRWYDWAWISIQAPEAHHPRSRWLLIRRNYTTGELAFYRCFAPGPVPLATLVRIAGRRWTIEESFQACKGLTGLDQHQVRRWISWHRWTILAMLAYAYLAVLATIERTRQCPPEGLIPLTCNEIHRLFNTLAIRPLSDIAHHLSWSTWRRRHQHRAKTSHYQQRTTTQP
ncbi:MAG: IS701 family transposase [Actinobacteria bacterium]|nr:IS701 family transposase [Actinomycetota bacterium]